MICGCRLIKVLMTENRKGQSGLDGLTLIVIVGAISVQPIFIRL